MTKDPQLADRVEELLCGGDSVLHRAASWPEVLVYLERYALDVILIDLALGEEEAISLCAKVREQTADVPTALLALVAEASDTTLGKLLEAGVDGLVGRRLRSLSFRLRINADLKRIKAYRALELKVRDSQLLMEITSRLLSTADTLDRLYDVTQLLSRELEIDRCSVVLVRADSNHGVVVASSDEPEINSLPIDVARYPEIAQAMASREPLVIKDVEQAPLLREMLPAIRSAGVGSAALFPITDGEETLGVIFLRFARPCDRFEEQEVIFCQTVANATAIALRNAEVVEHLKIKTQQMEIAQLKTRSQLVALKRYEDFFRSSVDGMVVISEQGRVVFVNPEAALLLNHDESEIVGRPLIEFLLPGEEKRFGQIVEEFGRVKGRRSLDLEIKFEERGQRTVAVSAGSLGEPGMVLLTMRDVTAERAMARQLADVQGQLIQHERRAAVIELAGGTAHELNQPLTSVMTAVAVLRRTAQREGMEAKMLDTVDQEVERMAEIIRRLGKLTQTTTKDYVGAAKIIDLDVSSSRSESSKETK